MQMRQFRKNLKYKFIFLLMLGSTLISISFFAYNYFSNKEHLEKLANQTADWSIQRLAQNLIVPLWEVDENWAKMITDTEMLAENIKAVSITGEGGLRVFQHRTEDGRVIASDSNYDGEYFIKRTAPVIHDGQLIGRVNIFFSDQHLKKELARELLANVSLAILIIIFLILAPSLILEHLVINPLEKILVVIKSADEKGEIQKVQIMSEDQIGYLANEFNKMIGTLKFKEKVMLSQSRQAAMGEMISMIAHQWRQPITSIAMGANSILLDVATGKIDTIQLQESSEKIVQQTIHLSKTIEDFKNFFSPDKSRESVNINSVIEEALSVIDKSLQHHDITLSKEYSDIDDVSIFSRELLQVILNILNNAKEALVDMDVPDPQIMLRTGQDKKHVHISICNNGFGIDEEILLKIFEPYFTTKDEKNGTGLGLYMSKIIVEKHFSGSLTAKNRSEGGVCFEISFPKPTQGVIHE